MTSRIFLFLLFCLTCMWHRATASDTLVVHDLSQTDSIPVLNHAAFLIDATNQQEWKAVMQQPFVSPPLLKAHINPVYGRKKVTVWLRLTVKNEMPDSLRLMILVPILCLHKQLIVLKRDDTVIHRYNHFFTKATKQERSNIITPVAPGEYITYLVQVYNPRLNLNGNGFLIADRKAYLAARGSTYHSAYTMYIFNLMFIAIVLFITLHTLVQFCIRRRKEFILYAIYSFTVLLFFVFKLESSLYYDIIFAYMPFVFKISNNLLSYLYYYTYFRFAREFVDFKSFCPVFNRTIIWTERLLIIGFAADLGCTLLNYSEWRSPVFLVIRLILLAVAFGGIWLLLRQGKTVLLFFGIGSLVLILGLSLAMFFSFYPELSPIFKNDPIHYMQVGIVLELLCFTSGLSYKTHLIEVEKRNTQQQLIRQLEENRRLQGELNLKLEAHVKEQTEQILAQQSELEKEKEQQLTLEFTKKITEMELQLLKTQLNPHFYFNTLNNLYGLAIIAPKKAPNAILKLSDIMEYVIYDCRHDKVPLAKELKFLQSYIELEKLRYDENVCISIDVQGRPDNRSISPMLLIQFVENGLKHGIEKEKTNSYLRIQIRVQNGSLEYESVNSIKTQSEKAGGIGLTNVRKRLDLLYPEKHQLQVIRDDNEFRVKLKLTL